MFAADMPRNLGQRIGRGIAPLLYTLSALYVILNFTEDALWMRFAKNFQSTTAYAGKQIAFPSTSWVPSPHQKNPK